MGIEVTGAEFKEIRRRLGMNHVEFARALGYKGTETNNHTLIKRIERGKRNVTPQIALKAIELDRESSA